ncbi:MAG: hypothetical protein ACYCX4_13060 [Bacillota bacterium]
MNWRKLFTCLTLVLVVLGLTLFSPPDKQLGNVTKLVYLHGAVVYATFILFTIAALAGLAVLAGFRNALRTAAGFYRIAIYYMFFNILLAPVVTRLTWGVYFEWAEPRFVITYFLFALSLGLGLIAGSLGSKRWVGLLYAVPAPLSVILLDLGTRIIHPAAPIFNSDSAAIKIFFAGMVLTMVILAVVAGGDRRQIPLSKAI